MVVRERRWYTAKQTKPNQLSVGLVTVRPISAWLR